MLFDSCASEHGTSVMFLLTGMTFGYSNLLEGYNCKVLPIKILSDEGQARLSDLIEAIKYAETMGASICNLSETTVEESDELYDVINNSKMLFVVAAGNSGELIDENNKVFPAIYNLDNVITVGAINQNGNIARFSNYSNKYVDVLAPGEKIISKNQYNERCCYSGTTYSVAFVSALAAKLLLEYDLESPKEIKKIITKSTYTHKGVDGYSRYGIIKR
ncbi:MAG: S8 family serine peptidase [Firmicutes bacterium]|nr:S8 family serine peptidase [Bacillota bacterium]